MNLRIFTMIYSPKMQIWCDLYSSFCSRQECGNGVAKSQPHMLIGHKIWIRDSHYGGKQARRYPCTIWWVWHEPLVNGQRTWNVGSHRANVGLDGPSKHGGSSKLEWFRILLDVGNTIISQPFKNVFFHKSPFSGSHLYIFILRAYSVLCFFTPRNLPTDFWRSCRARIPPRRK